MKKILFAITIILVCTLLGFGFWNYSDWQRTNKNITEDENMYEPSPEIMAEAEVFANTLNLQTVLVDQLISFIEDKDNDKKTNRFVDLFAPLGALDPISQPELGKYSGVFFNISYGYFSAYVGIPEKQAEFFVALPLDFSKNDFDQNKHFKDNEISLNTIQNSMRSSDELTILGIWGSNIIRANDVFVDYEQNLVWELKKSDNKYYDFSNVELIPLSTGIARYPILRSNSSSMEDLSEAMKASMINTVYKCDDVVIAIVGGVTNNAFGYIHGAGSSEEVNCGLLTDRFEIIKDEKIDENWRYWIGK